MSVEMSTIEYLRQYNQWRRGDESIGQPDPKILGEYIEKACKELEMVEGLNKHSGMLSRICGLVSEFCEDEEDTTLMAVARLRAKYYDSMSHESWEFVEKLKTNE